MWRVRVAVRVWDAYNGGMIRLHVVSLPLLLNPALLKGRSVVVFDVLRATTTMANALMNNAPAIHVYASNSAAREAAAAFGGPRLLAGEVDSLPAPGFDIGNSPADFSASRCDGRTIFMSTTNGTKALAACREADALYAAALVNARSTARHLHAAGRDVTLVCSGTDGLVSIEDLVGCGAVLSALEETSPVETQNDEGRIARHLFGLARRDTMSAFLATGTSGQKLKRVKYDRDIDFACRLSTLDCVVRVTNHDGTQIARRVTANANT